MASKDFSNRLKELRKRAGFTQKEVYEHFNIPQSTFSSWEVGKSEPSGEMLMQLCDFYKCDMMKEFSKENGDIVTNADLELLKKYHALDKHGKEMVDFTLKKEYERSAFLESNNEVEKYKKAQKFYDYVLERNKKYLTVDDFVVPIPDETAPPKTLSQLADDLINAAHAIENSHIEDRQHDEDIMDSEDF